VIFAWEGIRKGREAARERAAAAEAIISAEACAR
jgi:hypothetical protein